MRQEYYHYETSGEKTARVLTNLFLIGIVLHMLYLMFVAIFNIDTTKRVEKVEEGEEDDFATFNEFDKKVIGVAFTILMVALLVVNS